MKANLFTFLKNIVKGFDQHNRNQATDVLEYQLEEMEYVFAMLVYSSFLGIPGIPEFVAFELLPFMETELVKFEQKSENSDDMLADLFSKLSFE